MPSVAEQMRQTRLKREAERERTRQQRLKWEMDPEKVSRVVTKMLSGAVPEGKKVKTTKYPPLKAFEKALPPGSPYVDIAKSTVADYKAVSAMPEFADVRPENLLNIVMRGNLMKGEEAVRQKRFREARSGWRLWSDEPTTPALPQMGDLTQEEWEAQQPDIRRSSILGKVALSAGFGAGFEGAKRGIQKLAGEAATRNVRNWLLRQGAKQAALRVGTMGLAAGLVAAPEPLTSVIGTAMLLGPVAFTAMEEFGNWIRNTDWGQRNPKSAVAAEWAILPLGFEAWVKGKGMYAARKAAKAAFARKQRVAADFMDMKLAEAETFRAASAENILNLQRTREKAERTARFGFQATKRELDATLNALISAERGAGVLSPVLEVPGRPVFYSPYGQRHIRAKKPVVIPEKGLRIVGEGKGSPVVREIEAGLAAQKADQIVVGATPLQAQAEINARRMAKYDLIDPVSQGNVTATSANNMARDIEIMSGQSFPFGRWKNSLKRRGMLPSDEKPVYYAGDFAFGGEAAQTQVGKGFIAATREAGHRNNEVLNTAYKFMGQTVPKAPGELPRTTYRPDIAERPFRRVGEAVRTGQVVVQEELAVSTVASTTGYDIEVVRPAGKQLKRLVVRNTPKGTVEITIPRGTEVNARNLIQLIEGQGLPRFHKAVPKTQRVAKKKDRGQTKVEKQVQKDVEEAVGVTAKTEAQQDVVKDVTAENKATLSGRLDDLAKQDHKLIRETTKKTVVQKQPTDAPPPPVEKKPDPPKTTKKRMPVIERPEEVAFGQSVKDAIANGEPIQEFVGAQRWMTAHERAATIKTMNAVSKHGADMKPEDLALLIRAASQKEVETAAKLTGDVITGNWNVHKDWGEISAFFEANQAKLGNLSEAEFLRLSELMQAGTNPVPTKPGDEAMVKKLAGALQITPAGQAPKLKTRTQQKKEVKQKKQEQKAVTITRKATGAEIRKETVQTAKLFTEADDVAYLEDTLMDIARGKAVGVEQNKGLEALGVSPGVGGYLKKTEVELAKKKFAELAEKGKLTTKSGKELLAMIRPGGTKVVTPKPVPKEEYPPEMEGFLRSFFQHNDHATAETMGLYLKTSQGDASKVLRWGKDRGILREEGGRYLLETGEGGNAKKVIDAATGKTKGVAPSAVDTPTDKQTKKDLTKAILAVSTVGPLAAQLLPGLEDEVYGAVSPVAVRRFAQQAVSTFMQGGWKELKAEPIKVAKKKFGQLFGAMQEKGYLPKAVNDKQVFLEPENIMRPFKVGEGNIDIPDPQKVAARLGQMKQSWLDPYLGPFTRGHRMFAVDANGQEIMQHPAVHLASHLTVANTNTDQMLKVYGNIIRDVPGFAPAIDEVAIRMKPLVDKYQLMLSERVFHSELATRAERLVKSSSKKLDRLGRSKKSKSKKAREAAEEARATYDGMAGRWKQHDDAFHATDEQYEAFKSEWLQAVQELAPKHSSVRLFLATEDTPNFDWYPWLKGLMQPEELAAVARLKDMNASTAWRLALAGERKIITHRPYAHHAAHPDADFSQLAGAINAKMPDLEVTPLMAKVHSRSLETGDYAFMPDIHWSMHKYIPDINKRIEMIDFWRPGRKDGWQAFANHPEIRRTEAARRFFEDLNASLAPRQLDTFDKYMDRLYALEVFRLLAASASVTLKHGMKVTADLRIFGKHGASTMGEAGRSWSRIYARTPKVSRWLAERDVPVAAFDDAVKAVTNQGKMHQIIMERDMTPLYGQTKWDMVVNKMNEWGGSPVSLIEKFDRGQSFVSAMQMSANKGMTAEQALYGFFDTVLKTNFLSGPLNPSWLRSSKIRLLTIFQGTPFKLLEQRALIYQRAGRSMKKAMKITWEQLQDIRAAVKEGEHEFKFNLIRDALNSERDIWGTNMNRIFMRDLLALGTSIVAGGAIGADLFHLLFHFDPGLSPVMEAGRGTYSAWREQEYGLDDDEFWMSKFLKRWWGRRADEKPLPIPTTANKLWRIGRDDIPDIYQSAVPSLINVPASVLYFLSIKAHKEE